MIESKDFEELFGLLNVHDVRYLVVGGYAVAAHARPRFTDDLDLFVPTGAEDSIRLCAALLQFGFGPPEVVPALFQVKDRIVQIGLPPYRVDFLTAIPGLEFEESWGRRFAGSYGQSPVHFVCRDDLIASKLAADRPKDREDLRLLGLGTNL
jgi:hypothetical protein